MILGHILHQNCPKVKRKSPKGPRDRGPGVAADQETEVGVSFAFFWIDTYYGAANGEIKHSHNNIFLLCKLM